MKVLEIEYDEIINWGSIPKYENLRWFGISSDAEEGNIVSTSIENNVVRRTYHHYLPIPEELVEPISKIEMDMITLVGGGMYYGDAHISILRSYRSCLSIVVSYLYMSIMNRLREKNFIPSEEDWNEGISNPIKEGDIRRDNCVMATDDDLFMFFFKGTIKEEDGKEREVAFGNPFTFPYLIHHMYLTDEVIRYVFSSMGISYDAPQMNEDEDIEDDESWDDIVANMVGKMSYEVESCEEKMISYHDTIIEIINGASESSEKDRSEAYSKLKEIREIVTRDEDINTKDEDILCKMIDNFIEGKSKEDIASEYLRSIIQNRIIHIRNSNESYDIKIEKLKEIKELLDSKTEDLELLSEEDKTFLKSNVEIVINQLKGN